MQRQSLQPLLKIYNNSVPGEPTEDASMVTASPPSSSSTSASIAPIAAAVVVNGSVNGSAANEDDDKPMRNHRSPLIAMYHSKPERCLHAIPVLIFLCVFALYLCSHEPSPKDLVDIRGFRLPSELTELTDIDDFGRYKGKAEKTEIEIEEISFTQKRRFHRKLLLLAHHTQV